MEKLPFASGQPLTDKERQRDADARRQADQHAFARRKARRSGQRYDNRGTRAHKRAFDRYVGSE